MLIEATGIEGLGVVRWDPVHDLRGSFARLFCADALEDAGLSFSVGQVNLSHNTAVHTLRGMHYQREPFGEAKIVFCLSGRIWDVAVDMRADSPTYRSWRGVELGAGLLAALHIPTGFAHGFVTLEPDSEVLYLIEGRYVAEAGEGFRWDDPAIGIEWPVPPAVMAPRDANYPDLDRRR